MANGSGGVADPLLRLREWYAVTARDLPWRRPETTPWGVLVSEVMLQQTPVSRVLPAYAEWMERWPTPAALAASPSGEAVRQWGRLGYPRRGLRLWQAADACVRFHGGEVPSDPQQLRGLPGVGSYTAAAVAAFAYATRIPVIDTNVRRVVVRWSLGLPSSLTIPEGNVEALLPAEPADAVVTSIALMELGALVCVSRNPRCAVCPIAADCRWQLDGAPSAESLGIRTRTSQVYEGTDRQARGRLLALIRASKRPVTDDELKLVWPSAIQRVRAFDSLLADGLVAPAEGGWTLPG
jgi:A/G-specific adenine glycosylase